MLFSNEAIASYINDNFEPAWMSVRPVPRISIDFGNGRTITRTLHGNIATYVCAADGSVLDIVPGVYQPDAYFARLEQLERLHTWVTSGDDATARLQAYHTSQQALLARGERPHVLSYVPPPARADPSKVLRIERPVELVLQPAFPEQAVRAVAKEEKNLNPLLAADTRYNEAKRRPKVHARLAQPKLRRPQELTAWLYREVLNADIEDPYLGLADLLFAEYPFTEEERRADQPPAS